MYNKKEIRERVLHTPWHFMRWLRLIVGLFAIANTFFTRTSWSDSINIFILLIGFYFLAQALFGWGCAGASCQIPEKNQRKNN